jgi:threonine/homoserine/homoserine lactone efflux protein
MRLSSESLIALVVFLVPLQFSPGPANVFFAAVGARFGVGGATPPLVGYIGATLVVTTVIGLGFDATIFQQPAVLRPIQILGALYMLYLAWQFAREGWRKSAPETGEAYDDPRADRASFWQGAVVLLTNPKAYLIIGLTLAQFAYDGGTGHSVPGVMMVNLALAVACFASFVTWAAMGYGLMRALTRYQNAQNMVYAAMIFSVGAWMLWRAAAG